MAVALGLHTVFGSAEETTYGTPVAVDRRFAFVSESLHREQNVLQPQGITGGLTAMRRGALREVSTHGAAGDVAMAVGTKGFGRWFKYMLGGTPTIAQPDAVGAPTVYRQTHTFGALGPNRSMTLQKAVRDAAGTTLATFTYHGCKVQTWELSLSTQNYLQLSVGINAQEEETATAATALLAVAEPSYSAFSFTGGAITIGGSPVARVNSVTLSGDNGLQDDPYHLGTGGTKSEPEVDSFRGISGSLDAEFVDLATFYNRFTTDAAVQAVLTFTGANIASTYDEEIVITLPEIHITGESPQVGGPSIITQTIPFETAYNGTNAPMTLTYQSTDTAV